jgi:hypothetical protein
MLEVSATQTLGLVTEQLTLAEPLLGIESERPRGEQRRKKQGKPQERTTS